MEEHRLSFDVSAMFPEAAKRVEVLEQIKRSWPNFVENRAVAKNSYPYNMGVNELCVCVTSSYAESYLMRSKATIARRIAKHLGYDFGKDFVLTLSGKIPQPKPQAKKPKAPEIVVDEEKVRQYMQDAPETLPEDINYAVSRLQVLLEQRAANEKHNR